MSHTPTSFLMWLHHRWQRARDNRDTGLRGKNNNNFLFTFTPHVMVQSKDDKTRTRRSTKQDEN